MIKIGGVDDKNTLLILKERPRFPISRSYITTVGVSRTVKKLLSNLVLAGISLLTPTCLWFLGLQTRKDKLSSF